MRPVFKRNVAPLPLADEKDPIALARLLVGNISSMAERALAPDMDDAARLQALRMIFDVCGSAQNSLELVDSAFQKTKAESQIDALTGIYNRRYFEPALATGVTLAANTGTPLALLMFDIDHFKKVNDAHGHDAGDQVLQIFAQQLRKGLKEKDVVARLGGEEFVAILPGTNRVQAQKIANRLRQAVQNRPKEDGAPQVTVSIGLAMHSIGETTDTLMKRADQALYEAKRQGRNRVVGAHSLGAFRARACNAP